MSKIALVIKREYLTRVKKKAFIIISIIGPVLFAGLMIAPAIMANLDDKEDKIIAVIDETYLFNDSIYQKDLIPDSLIKDSSHIFIDVLPNTQYIKFEFVENKTVAEIRENFEESGYYAVLHIPHNITYNSGIVQLYSDKQPTMGAQMHISNSIEKEMERLKLRSIGIDQEVLKSVKTNIRVSTFKWEKGGKEKETNQDIARVVGLMSGMLIYMFIFMYGSQVMRGVIEEKTNRIVEVIVSSVRPFQLMMGKIIGIAFVSLTQILLWIVFTFIIVSVSYSLFFNESVSVEQLQPNNIMITETADIGQNIDEKEIENVINEAWASINQIDFGVMIFSFIFFFLGGYLLYASLFAAIGSAVDNETDTQQFMIPITIPLILAIVMMYSIFNNPEGPIAFWGSMIPLTSPIVMMARIPFGVPYWEIALSMGLLIITFVGSTWLAGKIYRTGILMYGKKSSYKELWKWLKYKN